MTSAESTIKNPASPFPVGSQSQLFIDQVLVRSAEGVSFTLHPAKRHPGNPLVKAELPWEGWRLELFGSVIYDAEDRLFKMWYIGETPDIPEYPVLYATSKDGIHWDKPLMGTAPLAKWTQHNVLTTGVMLAGVFKDLNDPNPARRYKMICYNNRANGPWEWLGKKWGYHTMVSPDGLHWEQLSRDPIAPEADVITGYYDRRLGLYAAFPKTHAGAVPGLPNPRRVFSVVTSRDFETWSQPELAIVPDLRDDAGSLARIEEVRSILDVPDNPDLMRTEFYGLGVHQAESCSLAFLWMFTVNNEARYGNQEGPGELQLAVSRDLKHWERPFRVPCVPRGKVGEWDCGFYVTAAETVCVGDEVRLYYGGSNYTHGTPCLYREEGTGRGTKYTGSIGLATWPRDRFVSVDGPAEGGALTTVPLTFSGDRLEINAATQPGGSVVVEILDVAGQVLSRSHPFAGDDLRHEVRWEMQISIRQLAGTPIALRFSLRKAQMFAFAFRVE